MAPSCAICSTPLTNCLRFIVSLGETSMKCSGSNVGMPEKRNFLPGVVIVSPIEKMPGIKHADDVARVGLVDDLALGGHHRLRLRKAHLAPRLDVEILGVALKPARADAHERQAVAVGLVHVGLDLEDERPRTRGGRRPPRPRRSRAAAAAWSSLRNAFKNGSTPKFVSALPKNTGESLPWRTASRSKSRPAPSSSTSSASVSRRA